MVFQCEKQVETLTETGMAREGKWENKSGEREKNMEKVIEQGLEIRQRWETIHGCKQIYDDMAEDVSTYYNIYIYNI